MVFPSDDVVPQLIIAVPADLSVYPTVLLFCISAHAVIRGSVCFGARLLDLSF